MTLGPIRAVTIATPELQRTIDAYQLYLGHELSEHDRLLPETAALWGLPGLAGRRYAWMLPGGEGPTGIRFVESPVPADYRPFLHHGWNAAEIMVEDTDAVAARLTDSPFPVIGEPADLSFSDKIRAMQVLGPARESLYLTSFKEKVAIFDVPDARRFVDRVFIVIVGGASAEAINAFHTRHFGLPKAEIMPAVISVISNAHGLPRDSKYPLAAIALSGQCYIEADTMPPGTLPRVAQTGELPPAISMVSFTVDRLPREGVEWLAPPRTLPEAPYHGRRAGVCVGAAGEWIELIEEGA